MIAGEREKLMSDYFLNPLSVLICDFEAFVCITYFYVVSMYEKKKIEGEPLC